MVSIATQKMRTRAEGWANQNGVKLLDKIEDYSTPIRYEVVKGQYTGCIGTRQAMYMRLDGTGVDWKSFTKDSKAEFICKTFSEEGFTVTALPISLSVCDKVVCLREEDNLEWEVTLVNFLKGKRPRSSNKSSKGEQLIEVLLLYSNIDFEREYPITINSKLLRYDFFIPDSNLYIEYNGQQHYAESGIYSEKMSLAVRQQYDKWKADYAKQNGTFVAIPYTVTSFKELTELLSKYIDVHLPTKEYIRQYNTDRILRETRIADYYLNHTEEATCKKFKTSPQSVQRAFKSIYGCNRTEYSRGHDSLATMLSYYLSHSQKDVRKKYRTSQYLDKKFKEVYGMSKKEYINKQNEIKYQEAVEYFKTHSDKETAKKYEISLTKLYASFKKTYGVTKTEFLRGDS